MYTDLNAFMRKLDARRQAKLKGKTPWNKKRRAYGTPRNHPAPHGLPKWMVRVARGQRKLLNVL